MWVFFTCWLDLSNMGGSVCHIWVGFVHMSGGLSYMGGVCHIWAGFVTLRGLSFFGRDLSNMGGISHKKG